MYAHPQYFMRTCTRRERNYSIRHRVGIQNPREKWRIHSVRSLERFKADDCKKGTEGTDIKKVQ